MNDAAPAIPYYLSTDKEEEVFLCAYRNRLSLMLKGPTGCGKTRFIEYMAARLQRPLITVSCNEDTTATDLLVRHLFKGGDTEWCDGPLTRGVRRNAIVYLDEIAEARSDAMVAIHPLTDYRRELFLDRTAETVKAQPEFMLVVSYNPGYRKSLRELKPSTRRGGRPPRLACFTAMAEPLTDDADARSALKALSIREGKMMSGLGAKAGFAYMRAILCEEFPGLSHRLKGRSGVCPRAIPWNTISEPSGKPRPIRETRLLSTSTARTPIGRKTKNREPNRTRPKSKARAGPRWRCWKARISKRPMCPSIPLKKSRPWRNSKEWTGSWTGWMI